MKQSTKAILAGMVLMTMMAAPAHADSKRDRDCQSYRNGNSYVKICTTDNDQRDLGWNDHNKYKQDDRGHRNKIHYNGHNKWDKEDEPVIVKHYYYGPYNHNKHHWHQKNKKRSKYVSYYYRDGRWWHF